MAYKNFTLDDLKLKFNLNEKRALLFSNIKNIELSDWLTKTLEITTKMPIKSEKSRSEYLVSPILLELKNRNNDFFTIYSGDTLVADKESGLTGECDFILTKNMETFTISFPIISVVEAKRQDIELGIDQCAAQMYGAKIFNEKHKNNTFTIYGCVTTGDTWQFLKLENDILIIDTKRYFYDNLPILLGVFQQIIDFYKEILK